MSSRPFFSFVAVPSISSAELAARQWDLGFHRVLSPAELDDWHHLVAILPVPSESPDVVSWPHSVSGHFSVKSCYRALSVGSTVTRFKDLWAARVPPKVKIFMWQAIHGRLPAADQIKKRHGHGSGCCSLCDNIEDTDHILFRCPLARLFWACTRDWLGVSWAPNSFGELRALTPSLAGQNKRLFWFGFSAMCWTLWTTRNKLNIEQVFPNKAVDRFFKFSIRLQRWKSLIKEGDLMAVELLISRVHASATNLLNRNRVGQL